VSFTTPSTLMTGAHVPSSGSRPSCSLANCPLRLFLANQRSPETNGFFPGWCSPSPPSPSRRNDYDENRHFLLAASTSANNFNHAMASIPVVQSQVNILRVEVWVTNRNGIRHGFPPDSGPYGPRPGSLPL